MKDEDYFEVEKGLRVGKDGSVWVRPVLGDKYAPKSAWAQIEPLVINRRRVVMIGKKYRTIGELVLEAFLRKRPKKPRMVVKHRDRNLLNDSVDNLYWGPMGGARGSLTAATAAEAWHLGQSGLGPDQVAEKLELENAAVIRRLFTGFIWNSITGLPPRGRNRRTLLDEPKVREIMKLAEDITLSAGDIAEKVGLGRKRDGVVRGVLNGTNWGHVTGIKRTWG